MEGYSVATENLSELRKQRDELLVVLESLRDWGGDLVLRDYVEDAIAKCKETNHD